MSNKIETLAKIQEVGIVAVVRATSIEQAEKITDACIAGGVAAIELTFTVPHADKLIEAMCAKYNSGEIIIGAGTVMDAATARIAILAGAQYIVSPYFDPETVKCCNRYGVPSMPGIYTPTEAVNAMECGADVLKVFPGDIAGPSFIKDIHSKRCYDAIRWR
jgi:2-dehydro-3-deoxyphosphogluconate aldolase/(4S)-4-hydroxy-2-oxoglutarate aldolase